MLRVDTRPRKRNAGRPPEKSAQQFLQWLRGRRCILNRTGECEGRLEAAHVDYAGGKGMGTKVADKFAVPMCSHHHRQQTDMSWPAFERLHKINALEMAASFWRAWPGRPAWERKLQDEGE